MSRSFRDLVVWQQAVSLAELIYRETSQFPKSEQFGLAIQMRKSSVSVASNIAEGSGRGTAKDFVQFLRIANGSLKELETQVEIASRVALLSTESKLIMDSQTKSVGKLLDRLIVSIKEGSGRADQSEGVNLTGD